MKRVKRLFLFPFIYYFKELITSKVSRRKWATYSPLISHEIQFFDGYNIKHMSNELMP